MQSKRPKRLLKVLPFKLIELFREPPSLEYPNSYNSSKRLLKVQNYLIALELECAVEVDEEDREITEAEDGRDDEVSNSSGFSKRPTFSWSNEPI
jgi:hypothetical protein